MSAGAKRAATRLKLFGFLAVGVIVVVAWLIIDTPESDGGTRVPRPDAEMSAQTSAELARAGTAQGVCYGWQLIDRITVVSRGSNLGPGVPVNSDPVRCPRWVQVVAQVRYTDASSEAADSASVDITSSGIAAPLVSRLDRFGLTTRTFIDEPDSAICRAALALPLLVAEGGGVPPAPGAPPSVAATGPADPGALPDAGSDFWRDRWAYVLGGVFLLLVAALTVAIGWFERRHQRRPAAPGRPGRSGRSGGSGRPAASGVGGTAATAKP